MGARERRVALHLDDSHEHRERQQFDPEPWILLNLVFSAVAFFTGALVIIAQKAQTRTDKANEVAAAKHRDELAQFQTDLLQRTPTSPNRSTC